jgi:hypothetical protein
MFSPLLEQGPNLCGSDHEKNIDPAARHVNVFIAAAKAED